MTRSVAPFFAATESLAQALSDPRSTLQRDAALHRFEATFELAWRALQHALRAQGIRRESPLECLQAAWRQGWVHDESAWRSILKQRMRTAHTYDDAVADQVYGELDGYLAESRALAKVLDSSSGS